MIIVIYFRFIYIITTTSCRYCKCYTRMLYATLRVASLRLLSYRVVSCRIVLRTPHTYTHADYAYTYMQSDRCVYIQLPNIIARTVMPCHTKRQNVLRSFFFKPGGGSNQIHFPFASSRLNVGYNPLLIYL